MVAGYRGDSRRDLIDSIPLDLLCDFIYGLMTENMDEKQRDEFDGQLFDPEVAQDDAKDERRRIAEQFKG